MMSYNDVFYSYGGKTSDDADDRSFFFFSSRRRHTRLQGDWSSDVCSSDLAQVLIARAQGGRRAGREDSQFEVTVCGKHAGSRRRGWRQRSTVRAGEVPARFAAAPGTWSVWSMAGAFGRYRKLLPRCCSGLAVVEELLHDAGSRHADRVLRAIVSRGGKHYDGRNLLAPPGVRRRLRRRSAQGEVR